MDQPNAQQERILRSQQKATDDEMSRILSDTDSKDYQDLRDRAAYVYVTGSIPTHLRALMNSLLRKITRYSRQPVSLDRRLGSMQLDESSIEALDLHDHPMIKKVRGYLDQGYTLAVRRTNTTRRPYSKVLMQGTRGEKITVQIDGSIKDGWA